MSKADRFKEEIGWLKVAFGIAVAVAVSLVGWLAQNYETASLIVTIAAVIAVVVVTAVIVFVNHRAYHRIEELEDA